jgi:hypothetical protein
LSLRKHPGRHDASHRRRAEPHDAEGIARVCAAGWHDTYRGIKEPERIEAVIAR